MRIDAPLITGSLSYNGTSLQDLSTYATTSSVNNLIQKTGSYALTGSNYFSGSQVISGSITATGNITAQTLIIQTVTSSVLFSTGSNIIGSSLSNVQQITGSVGITGSLAINGTATVVGSGTANYVPKFTAGSTVGNSLIFDNGTNVGIGTITPNGPLSVQANTGNTAIRLIGTSQSSSNNAGIYWYDSNDSTFNAYLGNFSTSFDIYNQRSTPMVFSTAGTERMRITSAGYLAIGITTAISPLTIQATSGGAGIRMVGRSPGNQDNEISFIANDNTTIQGYLTTSNAGMDLLTVVNQPMKFHTNSVERMRITSGGTVGIGLVPSNEDPVLIVKGRNNTSSGFALILQSSTSNLFYVRNDGFINTGTQSVSPYNNPTSGRTMVIESGGGLGYTSSTRESKANINSISNVDWINSLNPVSFNYRKKDNNRNYTEEFYNEVSYGFIADEVEKVNKELVFYNTDNELAGVEYNGMIAILTKAIQELSAKVTLLENK
jgi:hypothetical protein